MDWLTIWNTGAPLAGIVLGGFIGSRKRKADTHSVVVMDATNFASKVNERLDAANARIDELEERENRRDELARAHLRWDWSRVRELADLGREVPDPPPLFLYPDDLTKKGS